MAKKMVIYRSFEHNGKVIKVPMRQVSVHDSFIGIHPKTGKADNSEFMKLAEDLVPGIPGKTIDVLNV